jgi:hypothetical protein
MTEESDWLEVSLDVGSRRGLADLLAEQPGVTEQHPHLLRMLRSHRNELLLDRDQGQVVLRALNTDRRLSALRARLEAFLRA